jgi:hypothetical protein
MVTTTKIGQTYSVPKGLEGLTAFQFFYILVGLLQLSFGNITTQLQFKNKQTQTGDRK